MSTGNELMMQFGERLVKMEWSGSPDHFLRFFMAQMISFEL
jgi:hypothetical protein